MLNYEINVKEVRPFGKRIKNWLYLYLIVFILIVVSCGIHTHWKFGLIVGFLFFLIWFLPIVEKHRYYITKILLENGNVMIFYKDINQEKDISGNINDFTFRIKGKYRRGGPFLKINYWREKQLRQYIIDEWDADRFLKVTSVLK